MMMGDNNLYRYVSFPKGKTDGSNNLGRYNKYVAQDLIWKVADGSPLHNKALQLQVAKQNQSQAFD